MRAPRNIDPLRLAAIIAAVLVAVLATVIGVLGAWPPADVSRVYAAAIVLAGLAAGLRPPGAGTASTVTLALQHGGTAWLAGEAVASMMGGG